VKDSYLVSLFSHIHSHTPVNCHFTGALVVTNCAFIFFLQFQKRTYGD